MIAGVDLIPISYRLARRRKRYALGWLAGCAGYAMAALAVGLAAQGVWGRPDAPLVQKQAKLADQLKHTKAAIAALTPKIASMQTTLAASRTVALQPDWSVLLNVLAGLLDQNTVLASCRLVPVAAVGAAPASDGHEYAVDIRGLGRSQQAVAAYVLRLENTGLFDKVTLIDTHREPFMTADHPAIGFQLRCLLAASTDRDRGDRGRGRPGSLDMKSTKTVLKGGKP